MRSSRPVVRLAIYVAAFLAVGVTFELAFRHWRPILHATSHRSLFKAALLERRLPQDIIFFGTSRTVEALRPASFVSELSARGAPKRSAFNVATAFSSLEILDYLTNRFSNEKGLKLAVIEISEQQLQHMALPWETVEPEAKDFDERVSGWIASHSAFMAERRALLFNSLGRLIIVAVFGHAVDGTEILATDYLRAAAGLNDEVPPSKFAKVECSPRPLDSAPAGLTTLSAEQKLYLAIAKRLQQRGVQVAFYVPPTRAADFEGAPEHRALLASLHAQASVPVFDYSDCVLPADYFRDRTHMSRLGGAHFSRLLVEQLMAAADVRKGVADALP